MTVIAWDGHTLAADRRSTSGQTVQAVTKIHRYGKELLAVCGNFSVGQEMLAWYRGGALPDQFPASNRSLDQGAALIVIQPNGDVQKFESGPYPFRIEGGFAAFGCADQAALAVMALGFSAKRAVEIACMFNNGCGDGIDTLELETKE
jgi:hypothetical protein